MIRGIEKTDDIYRKSSLFDPPSEPMKRMASPWFSRPTIPANLRINPGLRHTSRIWTKPRASKRPQEYLDAQIKLVKNFDKAHPQLLMFLNDSKQIFSRQLPNMGAEYISRLVFDYNAITVMIIDKGVVKGGICARIFEEEEFVEIVFCAVESSLQSRGYGRLAMNYLKKVIQIIKIHDLLTCADNEAVTYFKKQGFNDKAIRINPKRWVGRIKDYEGVTLVHCIIYPDVDYMNFNKTIEKQIKYVEKKIGKRSHQPLFKESDIWSPYPEKPSFLNKRLPDIIEETDCDSRRDCERRRIENYNAYTKDLKMKLTWILNELKKKYGEIFYSPVTEDIAPGYFNNIKNPMDFLTIERRLNRFKDYYKKPEVFQADIELLIDNCKHFNQPDTPFYKEANSCLQYFKQLYNNKFPDNY